MRLILSHPRYYAVVHPLKAQYLCTTSKAKKTVAMAWISAFFLGVPMLVAQVSDDSEACNTVTNKACYEAYNTYVCTWV